MAKRHRYGNLMSELWRELKRRVIALRGAYCEQCHASGPRLVLHHLNYPPPGTEQLDDVRLLCNACHARRHNKMPTV